MSEDTTGSATTTAAATTARDRAPDGTLDATADGTRAPGSVAAGTTGERRETPDQVTVRLPAEGAYLSVLRTATVADVGRAINPQLVERQDEGATGRRLV